MWFEFKWQCLKRTVVDTWRFFGSKLRSALFVVASIIGWPILYFLSGREQLMEELYARIAFGFAPFGVLALGILFWNAVLSPFRVWREETRKRQCVESQRDHKAAQLAELQCAISPGLEIIGDQEQILNKRGRAFAIEVRNPGLKDVIGCHGRLLGLAFEDSEDTGTLDGKPRNRDLHWSGQVENATAYDVPASQRATLNVIYADRVADKGQLVMLAYRGREEFRQDHALPQDRPILIWLRISSSERKPIDIVCRVNPDLVVNLAKQAYSGNKPFEIVCSTEDEDIDLTQFTLPSIEHSGDSPIAEASEEYPEIAKGCPDC